MIRTAFTLLLYAIAFIPVKNVFSDTLSSSHPDDENISNSTTVLFHEDFENGWGKWDYPSNNNNYLFLEKSSIDAHNGNGFLRSTITEQDLKRQHYISADARNTLIKPADNIYWRFYTRFNANSPTPHHWVMLGASDGSFDIRGKANTLPEGDKAFWLALDINNKDLFSFYVYWHNMRSGRCNDGTALPGCAGDQGNTYYYGNTFRPAGQKPMPRDEWFCVEINAKANSIGQNDGELSLWINDKLVGNYKQGIPTGTWLRDQFRSDGCMFDACTEPEPFEGFNFRSSEKVKFSHIFIDAYYQLDTYNEKIIDIHKNGARPVDEQTIYYDDIVVATERIGCMTSKLPK